MARDDSRPVGLPEALLAEYESLFPDHFADFRFPAGEDENKLRVLMQTLSALEGGPRALCLSGGGIRSATFSLGILQGFAHRGLLEQFDYLSTVSGGGYIGAWLSALSLRRGGIQQACASLCAGKDFAEERDTAAPIEFLRDYSNYLTPRLGLFSADTWAAVGIVSRNLLMNWLVLLPAIGLLLQLPRLGVQLALLDPPALQYMWLCVALAAIGIASAVSYVERDLPSAGDKHGAPEHFRTQYLGPLFAALTVLTLCWIWYGDAIHELTHSGGLLVALLIFGVVSHILGSVAGRLGPIFSSRSRTVKSSIGSTFDLLGELPVLAAVGAAAGLLTWVLLRLVPASVYTRYASDHVQVVPFYIWLAIPALLTVWVVSTALYTGLACRWTNEEDFEWFARAAGLVLLSAVAWLAIGAIALFLPRWLVSDDGVSAFTWLFHALGGGGAILTLVVGRSAKFGAALSDKSTGLDQFVSKVAAPLGATFVFVLVALGVQALEQTVPEGWSSFCQDRTLGQMLIVSGCLFFVLLSANFLINVNRFSLHALYRNRLVRAFLGASRAPDRSANPFTGFDPDDDVAMSELAALRPLHVINIALNLVKGKRLAWQHRKAEAFTVSALHCGSSAAGSYRPTASYGQGITLGTAVAISGAAASPNMGYHSSALATLLMTLFNVRLGWWLGNPKQQGQRSWKKPGPGFAIRPIVAEALGWTDDENRYVYLSDGGHFENLGLYEMVLRRCKSIVVVDCSCDQGYTFEDFGNAVRKIRIDLGIPIELDAPISEQLDVRRTVRFYTGKISYSAAGDARDGTLIYIKPAIAGDEPADVRHYRAAHPEFPHESTIDQFFDEPQFESYRKLGEHTAACLTASLDSVQRTTSDVAPALVASRRRA